MIIGMLPASGKASRVRGIPKFCLPISNDESLIEWHIKKMSEVCDYIKVSTKMEWAPILKNLNIDVEIKIIEPSTMSDAILKMGADESDTVLVGMPDTIILNSEENFYKKLLNKPDDLVLASWEFYEGLRGHTGQIEYDLNDNIINIIDKDFSCNLPRNWGAFKIKNINKHLDKDCDSISKNLLNIIVSGNKISMIRCDGKFIDAGTITGIKELYSSIK